MKRSSASGRAAGLSVISVMTEITADTVDAVKPARAPGSVGIQAEFRPGSSMEFLHLTTPACRESGIRRRPAAFWQNELPPKKGAESMDYARLKVPFTWGDPSGTVWRRVTFEGSRSTIKARGKHPRPIFTRQP